jgi:mycofactocin precursor
MPEQTIDPAEQSPLAAATPQPEAPAPVQAGADLVEEDLLVEDVSIDGMCGVY